MYVIIHHFQIINTFKTEAISCINSIVLLDTMCCLPDHSRGKLLCVSGHFVLTRDQYTLGSTTSGLRLYLELASKVDALSSSLSVSIVLIGSSGFSKDLPLFCSNSNFFVNSLFSFSLMTDFKTPEGVVVGFQIFAWAPNLK